jgi:hypothetical protein
MKMRALRGQSAGYAYALVDLDQLGYFETQPHGNVNTTGASIISDSTKNETISRRNVFSLFGKVAAFAIATPATALATSDAEAATVGMERRQGRRTGRHERRGERRTGRHERREERRN